MPVVVAGKPADPASPFGICADSGQRERFVIGPGPDTGGSDQGEDGCCQTPVKSGRDAVSSVPPSLLSDVCASAGTAVIAMTATQSRALRWNDMASPHSFRVVLPLGRANLAQKSGLSACGIGNTS